MSHPPAGSPFVDLDPSIAEMLQRSFDAQRASTPGAVWILDDGKRLPPEQEASWNLANAYWGGAKPTTVWEALEACGAEWVNLLVRVHERMRAIDPTLGLWKQIRYVRNGWWAGSGGFKVVYFDPAEMRHRLAALSTHSTQRRVGRDTLIGSLEHQLESSSKVLIAKLRDDPKSVFDETAEPPDAVTFREVSRPKEEALHFCVGLSDQKPELAGARHFKLDDIHIDWSSPVSGVSPEGTCKYAGPFLAAQHWLQAMLHVQAPTFFFDATDKRIAALEAKSLPAPLEAQLVELGEEWRARRFLIAAQGKAGIAQAAVFWSRAGALKDKAGK